MSTVRIFLSSPGDVAAERSQARELLLGLARGPFVRGRVHIDVVSWDDPHRRATMDARFTPQQALDRSLPTPAECDLTVVLLWGRMGTPLTEKKADGTPYLSGTEWEFENALAANRPVFVYRRSQDVLLNPDDPEFEEKVAQKRRVNAFFERFKADGGTLRRAHATYESIDDLLHRLRQDVEQYLSGVLPDSVVEPARALPTVLLRRVPAPQEVPLPSEPYPLLGPYTHPLTFTGRDTEIAALATRVEMSPLVLCVHAASGAGKSSLLLAGLAPRLRADGHTVSIDRTPGEQRLAQRLLRDVLEPAETIDLADDSPDLAQTFSHWVLRVHALSGRPTVFVLDQVDDVLRNREKRQQALAAIGPLLAATAQRLPGSQDFACKWVLCYRHEFHGAVRAWLEDVLAEARALDRRGLDQLPSNLSDTQKSHDWAIPVFGRASSEDRKGSASRHAFLRAIVQPLEIVDQGRRHYPYEIRIDGAERLATVFAQFRRDEPDAPLVPELQVVLNDLLQRAREQAPAPTESATVVEVPEGDELRHQIRHALRGHVERALNRAFPQGCEEIAGIQGRTRALIALRHLTDAEGRRAEGLPQRILISMIGREGSEVLVKLAAADTRLVVIDHQGLCQLSHDCLAEAVTEVVASEANRRTLTVDQTLIDLYRTIGQKAELFASDTADNSALALTEQQREMILNNSETLLEADTRLETEKRRTW